jgi:hypothetical protein
MEPKVAWLECTNCDYTAEIRTLGLLSLTDQANRQREESV